MKKVLFAVPALLALSACSAAPVSASVPDVPFSAKADVTYAGTDFSANIRRSAAGKWEISITEPYSLEGLTMTLCGDETRLYLLGIEAAADTSGNTVSAAKAIAAAYDAAIKSSASFVGTDDGYTMSGTCELGDYTFSLGKDGVPLAFSCDPAGLSVTLSDFAQLPPEEIEAEIVE